MQANFRGRSFANHSLASMTNILLVGEGTDLRQNLGQASGRSAGSVLLQAVVHFHDLEVEIRSENLGSLVCKPEKSVYADTEIWRENDRNLAGRLCNALPAHGGLTGCPDNEDLPGGSTGLRERSCAIG